MQLFVYFNSNDDYIFRLQEEINFFSNLIEVRYFNQFEAFTLALRKSSLSRTLIIYCASNENCIQRALSIKNLLVKTKLLIILRETDSTLVSKVNELHPRYYTFASGDLKDVKAVIAKMIDSIDPTWSPVGSIRSQQSRIYSNP